MTIDDGASLDFSNPNVAFDVTPGYKHIIQHSRIEIVAMRVQFDPADPAELPSVDFNVVESIAAERFVGQTFEAQRGIAFISDLGPQRIAMDQQGIRGWRDINVEVDGQTKPTFNLGLNGSFFVGYKDYPGVFDDAYMHFDPTANDGQGALRIRAILEVLPGGNAATKEDIQDSTGNIKIRADLEPKNRPGGGELIPGDTWIETAEGKGDLP